MADVEFRVEARDETRPTTRRIERNFEQAGNRVGTRLRQTGRVGAQALKAVGVAAAAATAAVTALGAGAALAFRSILMGAVESASELERFHRLTSINTETLQIWRTALVDLGGDLGDVQGAISGMNDFLQEAANGAEDATNTLFQLGISFEELNRNTPEYQLERIFLALNNVEDAGTRAALAHRIMGEDFEKLNVIFSRTDEEMSALADRTNFLSQANLQTAAVIRAATADIGTSFHSLSLEIAQSFIEQAANAATGSQNVIASLDVVLAYVRDNWQDLGRTATQPVPHLRATARPHHGERSC